MGHMRWHLLVSNVLKSLDREGVKFYSRRLPSTKILSHQQLCFHTEDGNVPRLRKPKGLFPDVLTPFLMHGRSFSVAVDVQHPQAEFDNHSENEISNSTEGGEVLSRKEKLPAEVALQKFFERAMAIAQVLELLKKMTWGDELKRELRKLSVTYDTLLVTQVLREDLPCDLALNFFHWLKDQDDFKHNEYTYGVMINTLGKVGRVNEMQELFNEMKSEGCKVTPVGLSSVMLWLSKAEDAQGVVRHWEKLKRTGNKPSVAIYTAYIDLLIRTKRYSKISHIYQEMLKEECLPSSRTHTLFIQHLVKAGKVDPAHKILEIIQTMKVVPNRVTYESLINGYALAGNVDMVLRLLNEMREHFYRPSKRLIPAVKALQNATREQEATNLMREIWPESHIKDIGDIKHLDGQLSDDDMDAADGAALPDCLMTEWRSVTSSNVGFDVNAFAQALHSWNPSVEGVLEQANVEWKSSLILEILRRARNLETSWPFFHWVKGRAGFKHDSYSCMLMIQRILMSRSHLMKRASLVKKLFEGLRKDGFNFTVPMFNMVIRHFVNAGEAEKALEIFNWIKDFDLEPNEFSYASVIQGLANNRQVSKAMDMMEAMQEAGFQLDSMTSAKLIFCLGLAGKTERAYSLFSKILESGRNPSCVEYKAIMATYSRVGDQKMALKLYEQMRGAGIAPTQDMYEVVSVILRKANRLLDIKGIAEERKALNFFGGSKKALQESLLQVLALFTENIQPRKALPLVTD